ncbi:hypothetical protein [Enterococcus hirae]|uniref:hypothetical protein n=1 Tax=Enterococcus hirae TaxID=1354 RepID=UPI001A95B0FB|nr:hypothetical protein [Enterococcus hirae]MBO1088475.1 hypothetical protein [Enterococcus hirae]MEB7518404.1 hypothetical protein [Enterococcus hirae]
MEVKIGTVISAPSVSETLVKGEIIDILKRVVVVSTDVDHYVVKKEKLLANGYTLSTEDVISNS